MSSLQALAGFSALAHPLRLALFRELSVRAPLSIPAGELAIKLQTPPSTMTGHLHALEQAGLIKVKKRARYRLYSLDATGVQYLIDYLKDDCLGGHLDKLLTLSDEPV